jgi:hypothetical protein
MKILSLETDEFLRRFLLHVVPRSFMRIRHFGLLANRTRRAMLTRCRDLLGQQSTEEPPPKSAALLMHQLTGVDLSRCPVCGEGRMQVTTIRSRDRRLLHVPRHNSGAWRSSDRRHTRH